MNFLKKEFIELTKILNCSLRTHAFRVQCVSTDTKQFGKYGHSLKIFEHFKMKIQKTCLNVPQRVWITF